MIVTVEIWPEDAKYVNSMGKLYSNRHNHYI